jgi:ribosomal protein S18 acetylase RimI-like enzyme
MSDTSVCKAEARDLPSIGTLHARAFHRKSEWHRKFFPSILAPWWEEKYALDIEDPNCYVLKISSPESSTTVLGLIFLRKYKADERGAGPGSSLPPPPDVVDPKIFDAMINSMIKYREQFMFGKPHLCVEHFGVDADYQGSGMGITLMEKACEIADREKLDVFVEANEFAESFYQRHGFKTEQKLEMPGGLTECFLIRRFAA